MFVVLAALPLSVLFIAASLGMIVKIMVLDLYLASDKHFFLSLYKIELARIDSLISDRIHYQQFPFDRLLHNPLVILC